MQAEANGIRIEYRAEGSGTQWVTLVTGIANDLSMWDRQAAALERDFKVLRYDLRGQGGTEVTAGPYSIELLLKDLVGLWDVLGIEKTHLIGLGFGGAIVQAAAIDYPGRLLRLAPCCCRAQMVPDFAKLWEHLIAEATQNGIESIVEHTVQRWFSEEFKEENPQVLEGVRRMIRRTSLQGYLGCIAAFLGLSLEDQIHRIKARTLYVSGVYDKIGGPPALMAGLAAKVPGARHTSVLNAAHIANIQNPGAFNGVLLGFLREK